MGSDPMIAAVSEALAPIGGAPADSVSLHRLSGGACQELFRVEASWGDRARRFVLRADARSSLPGSLSRAEEYAVVVAAFAAGVRTPRPHALIADLPRPGASAWLMDFVAGETIGAKITRDPAFEVARPALVSDLARELAAVHRVRPEAHPQLALRAIPFLGDPAESALAWIEGMLGALQEPHPELTSILRWLRRAPPVGGPVVLVHGDFRVGNFLVNQTGLAGLLDWEFAHWGAPEEDLAWLCVRDWRFGVLNRPVGGLARRADFYAAYAAAAGHPVDPERVRWWEVLGNLRWAAGAILQGERYLSGAETDVEHLAIARRAPEISWEALRLIRVGDAAMSKGVR